MGGWGSKVPEYVKGTGYSHPTPTLKYVLTIFYIISLHFPNCYTGPWRRVLLSRGDNLACALFGYTDRDHCAGGSGRRNLGPDVRSRFTFGSQQTTARENL